MQHKILIVDDEENIRFILKAAIPNTYQVLTAANGLAAVEVIKKEKPTLVFLDMKMPGISGLEVLGLVKETGINPVIWMVTGEEDLEVALKALQTGAAGYLTKPIEVKKIRDIISNTIAQADQKEHHETPSGRPWQVKKNP